MSNGAIISPQALQVIRHIAGPRAAWLWSADGAVLLWANAAAYCFGDVRGARLSPAVPISGTVSRLVRMAFAASSYPSRVQFQIAGRPLAATCDCSLLDIEGAPALLMVAQEPVAPEVLAVSDRSPPLPLVVLPLGSSALLTGNQGNAVSWSENWPADLADALADADWTGKDGRDAARIDSKSGHYVVQRFAAGAPGAWLHVANSLELPTSPPDIEAVAPDAPEGPTEAEPEPTPKEPDRKLTSLFDRLAVNEELFLPLGPADDVGPEAGTEAPAAEKASPEGEEAPQAEQDKERPELGEPVRVEAAPQHQLWKISARHVLPPAEVAGSSAPEAPHTAGEAPQDQGIADHERHPDRSSRYNFEELARILADRVGGEPPAATPDTARPADTAGEPRPARDRRLVALGDETLVLNRIPLGILVFRDQQVLFLNRAMAELTGYQTGELREVGLAAIFGDDTEPTLDAGPVTHLIRQDGARVPVNARLQMVSWQGRPALMLSASSRTSAEGTEAAVRSFAELAAQRMAQGFISASRAGIVETVSAKAAELLGDAPEALVGRPFAALVAPSDNPALKAFLERPARFAETQRPAITLTGARAHLEITLFAQGNAGKVSGYFGLVDLHPGHGEKPEDEASGQTREAGDPALLGRVSRGIRRPLNTIIGFSELIRSAAFGPIENHRYVEYARDIKSAGVEIAELVDELEQYARLSDVRYAPRPGDVDLASLLDDCVGRVRSQAGIARVLVRSAISERLPAIRADAGSLGQAIRNLLASAIGQTRQGGKVVLSAQPEPDGSVSVHVRDSAAPGELAERFVVFREVASGTDAPPRPAASSVGLTLTRSLIAANGCKLTFDPTGGVGTLMTVTIPAELVVRRPKA
ncbi:MAG TPA: PAS domain-containing protein [Devosiaceae bacterium]